MNSAQYARQNALYPTKIECAYGPNLGQIAENCYQDMYRAVVRQVSRRYLKCNRAFDHVDVAMFANVSPSFSYDIIESLLNELRRRFEMGGYEVTWSDALGRQYGLPIDFTISWDKCC